MPVSFHAMHECMYVCICILASPLHVSPDQAVSMSQLEQIAQAWQLHQTGALSIDEYAGMKAKILSAETPPPPTTSVVPNQAAMAGIQDFFGSLAGVINELRPSPQGLTFGTFPGGSPTPVASVIKGRDMPAHTDHVAMGVDKLPVPSPRETTVTPRKRQSLQQPSIFEAGAHSVVHAKGKKIKIAGSLSTPKPLLDSATTRRRNTILQCRWCNEVFNHGPARTAHEQTHTGPQRGQRSVFDSAKMKAQMTERQKDREIEVQCRFCLNDVIAEVEKLAIPVRVVGNNGKETKLRNDGKVDGRCNNRGANIRQQRSNMFKWKVIQQVERFQEEYPEWGPECAALVAGQYNCTCDQVRKWVKKRESIKRAATRKDGHKARDRKQKGRFNLAEAEVFKQFKAARAKGQRVGPRWICQCARREVHKCYEGTPLAELAKTFAAKQGWLRRFCSRWSISLRRKTNVKRTPIQERLGKIQRYFALLRIRLRSYNKQPLYCEKWALWKPKYRWSLDQVPAGFFAPTSTYELKGARRVHIASNGSADSHRECTLQVCIRGWKDPSKPRPGQPKLVICFKGKGMRISAAEKAAYREHVLVQWDPKAWYNERMCMEWAVLAAVEIFEPGHDHLVFADNLSGQTTKQFKDYLLKHSRATLHNLVAGCTDEIQVVDDGFGALVKFYAQEVSDEWLMVDCNWKEWCSTTLSASRRRVLLTHWYGEGYVRACAKYDFEKHFRNVGSSLTADGSEDALIKLQGVEGFTFCEGDAERDAITGEFVDGDGSLADCDQAESDDEEEDLSENSEAAEGEASDMGDETEEEKDVGPYEVEQGWEVVEKFRFKEAKELVNIHFVYKFSAKKNEDGEVIGGWERGRVTGIEKNKDSPDFGMFIVKFTAEKHKRCIRLDEDDYDIDDIWVEIKRSRKK